jgi:hypothetical protein
MNDKLLSCLRSFGCCAAAVLCMSNLASGATVTLLNISGTGPRNFNDTSIWDLGTVPGSADFPVMAMGDGINDYVYVDSSQTVQRINVGNALSGGLEIRAGATLATNVTGSSQSNIGPGGASPGVGYLRIQSGATLNQAGLLLVGLNANGTGTVTLEAGGTHTLAGALTVGSSGSGTYNMLGGTLNAAANVIVGNTATGNGAFNMSGGSLTTGTFLQIAAAGTSNGAFKQSNGTLQINRSSTTAQGLFVAFTAGTTGLYEISGGTLNVANTNTGILNGANAIAGGAAGTFRIVGSAPTITVGKDYTQRPAAKLDVVIDAGGISPINLGGNAVLDGILSASFTATPMMGQQFPIINYTGARTGTFATFDSLVDGPLGPDTIQLSIDYGTGTNSAVVLTVVPEPASLVLVGMFLFGAAFVRCRTTY